METRDIAYKIDSIEKYGFLLAYCIERDISVSRCYWDEREKDIRCYHIDYLNNWVSYSTEYFYRENNYIIVKPEFYFDCFGQSNIRYIRGLQ